MLLPQVNQVVRPDDAFAACRLEFLLLADASEVVLLCRPVFLRQVAHELQVVVAEFVSVSALWLLLGLVALSVVGAIVVIIFIISIAICDLLFRLFLIIGVVGVLTPN